MQNQEQVNEKTLKGIEELKRLADGEGVSLLEYIRACREKLMQAAPKNV